MLQNSILADSDDKIDFLVSEIEVRNLDLIFNHVFFIDSKYEDINALGTFTNHNGTLE